MGEHYPCIKDYMHIIFLQWKVGSGVEDNMHASRIKTNVEQYYIYEKGHIHVNINLYG